MLALAIGIALIATGIIAFAYSASRFLADGYDDYDAGLLAEVTQEARDQ